MSGRPVLIVDDDTTIRRVLERALAGAELEYVSVGSGAEALAQINRVQPSLVLLDLIMPEVDGYKILRTLRARPATRDLPVVVLTALESEEAIVKAFEAGADDYVRKPFKTVEIVARVRGQLRLRTAMDALARREKDAQLVLELTQALASNLDFRGILFTVVQRIAEVARVDRVSIVLVRDDNEQIGYVVAASDDRELRDLAIDLKKYPEIRQVLASGEPLVVEDAGTHSLLEIVREAGMQSAAFASLGILPILYEGRPMGVLFLRSRRAGAFGARELAVCRTIASAMAIALRNARILQSLRDHTQQETEARFEAERRVKVFERYADFFDSSADGIIVIDKNGRLLFGNPKSREISGYGERELRGRLIDQICVNDEEVTRFSELRAGFVRGIFPRDVDVHVRARDGRILVVNVSFASVLREEGVVLCSFRDVTRQREVEAELVKTKDSLRRVIDASADAIVSCDTRKHVVLFSQAAERLFGCASKDIIGADASRLFPDGDLERIREMMRDGGGRVDGAKVDILDTSGARVPVSFSGAFIHEGDTQVGSVSILTDLREKMRMEQQLQQAQERILAQERQAAVAKLAGAAAHELNQPLTSVRSYATLLRRLLEAGTQAAAAAAVIEGEADRMAEIVRQLGKVTKFVTKNYVGDTEIVDLELSAGAQSVKVEGEDEEPSACSGTNVHSAPSLEPSTGTGSERQ
ncbi:MAG: PAS domain S-box protein [Polyangiaceae bacterium]|nr:PAS domain S-box protein [Polyangiaceae bacterium]